MLVCFALQKNEKSYNLLDIYVWMFIIIVTIASGAMRGRTLFCEDFSYGNSGFPASAGASLSSRKRG